MVVLWFSFGFCAFHAMGSSAIWGEVMLLSARVTAKVTAPVI
jgi:hypothetical protein